MNLGTVSQNELSVLIKFISDDKGIFNAKRKIDKLTKDIKVMNSKIARDVTEAVNKSVQPSGIDRYMKDINQGWAKLNKPVKAVKEDMGELNRSFNTVMKSNNLLTKRVSKGFTSVNSVMKTTLTKQQQLNQHTKRFQKPFAGWAMSIMFAGMALQRYSMQLYKFGTKAFQEISHSIEGTTTNTDMLEGSMKYLGFVVGQALEPLIGWLIPIIDKVAEWTEKNPKLTATIVALGVGLGTLFMVGGMGVLAINGFIDLAAKIGLMSSSAISGGTQVTSLGSKLKNLGHTLRPGGTLMTAMGAGLAIAAVIRMFGKDWKNSTPTVKDWLTNLGMTTAAGFMIGGVPGALVGFTIGAFLMVSQETIKGALKQIENFTRAQQAIQEKFARGEILTAEEAYKINFQGTVLPSGYQDRMQKELEDWANTLREGSAIWQEEQRKQKENMQGVIRGEYSGSAYEQVYGNTYYIDTIKIEDPQAIESLNNLTKLAGG